MRGEIKNWDNGWYGISLALSVPEIHRLLSLLTTIRDDPEQHFHISSDYSGCGGIGDIEISVAEAGTIGNLTFSGGALPPGTELPQAGV